MKATWSNVHAPVMKATRIQANKYYKANTVIIVTDSINKDNSQRNVQRPGTNNNKSRPQLTYPTRRTTTKQSSYNSNYTSSRSTNWRLHEMYANRMQVYMCKKLQVSTNWMNKTREQQWKCKSCQQDKCMDQCQSRRITMQTYKCNAVIKIHVRIQYWRSSTLQRWSK